MTRNVVALLRAAINLAWPTISPKSRGDMAHARVDRLAARLGVQA